MEGGSIRAGGLVVSNAIQAYSGTISADISGPGALDQLGTGTVVLLGDNTYSGGTSAEGTLIAANQDSLPGVAVGTGTVIVAHAVLVRQRRLDHGPVATRRRHAHTLDRRQQRGHCRRLPDHSLRRSERGCDHRCGRRHDRAAAARSRSPPGEPRSTSLSGTAAIDVAIAGAAAWRRPAAGTLLLDGTLPVSGTALVDAGTLDPISPLDPAPVVVGRPGDRPRRGLQAAASRLYDLDPAMFSLVQSLFVDRTIDRADMIQILQSAVVDGAVTPAALQALEILTTPQNEAGLNMPTTWRCWPSDVVNGNPANADYQGQPLGNLADQTSRAGHGHGLDRPGRQMVLRHGPAGRFPRA